MPANNCTIIGLRGYNTGTSGYGYNPSGWNSDYRDRDTYAGHVWNRYTVTIIKFRTNGIIGVSDNISLKLSTILGSDGAPTNVNINWAICTSDENKHLYCTTAGFPNDPYRISSGTGNFQGLSNQVTNCYNYLNAPGLKPNTYYYIYLWASTQSGGNFIQPYTTGGYSHNISLNSRNVYKITFNPNGGNGGPGTIDKVHGKTIAMSSLAKPSKPNSSSKSNFTITGNTNGGTPASISCTATKTITYSYQFSHWNTAADGSGTSYGAGIKDLDIDRNATLYAIYNQSSTTSYANNTLADLLRGNSISRPSTTANAYTVTFDPNKGQCQTKNLTSTITTSYSFNKWSQNSNGSGATYNNGSQFTANTTIYAIWNSTPKHNPITLPTATRKGYDFLGWAKSPTDKSGVTGSYMVSSSHTLYAIWEAKGLIRVYTDGRWRESLVFVYVDGKWVQAIPWVFDGTSWKIGG